MQLVRAFGEQFSIFANLGLTLNEGINSRLDMDTNDSLQAVIMKRIRNVSPGLFTAATLVAVVAWHPTARAQSVGQKEAAPEAKPAALGLTDPFEVNCLHNPDAK